MAYFTLQQSVSCDNNYVLRWDTRKTGREKLRVQTSFSLRKYEFFYFFVFLHYVLPTWHKIYRYVLYTFAQ